MASVMNIISSIFALFGMFGLALAIVFPFIAIYFWLKDKILKRKIPEEIKREVENERQKRDIEREGARRRYGGGDDRRGETRTFRETINDSPATDRSISRDREVINRRSFPPLPSAIAPGTEQLDERKQRSSKRNWQQFS